MAKACGLRSALLDMPQRNRFAPSEAQLSVNCHSTTAADRPNLTVLTNALVTSEAQVYFESGGYAFFGTKAKKRLGLSTMIARSVSSFNPA